MWIPSAAGLLQTKILSGQVKQIGDALYGLNVLYKDR